MLNKQDFCEAIKEIIKYQESLEDLNKVDSNLSTAIIEGYSLLDPMIHLLDSSMNLHSDSQVGSTISWWVYDTKCGTDHPEVWFNKNRKDEVLFVLDTVEKLYEFCLIEGKQNDK